MPHRYSTVARLDLAAILPRPPDLDGHPTLRLWLMIAGSIGHSAVGSGGGRVAGAVGLKVRAAQPEHLQVQPEVLAGLADSFHAVALHRRRGPGE
jgi:hypothetical protein